MMTRGIRLFFNTASGILLLTGAAKLASAFGSAPVLEMTDPVAGITYRRLMVGVGLVEVLLAASCLGRKRPLFQAAAVTGFATAVAAYRLSLFIVGYHGPCRCAGRLMEALGIPEQVENGVMLVTLAYLLAGGNAALYWLRGSR